MLQGLRNRGSFLYEPRISVAKEPILWPREEKITGKRVLFCSPRSVLVLRAVLFLSNLLWQGLFRVPSQKFAGGRAVLLQILVRKSTQERFVCETLDSYRDPKLPSPKFLEKTPNLLSWAWGVVNIFQSFGA